MWLVTCHMFHVAGHPSRVTCLIADVIGFVCDDDEWWTLIIYRDEGGVVDHREPAVGCEEGGGDDSFSISDDRWRCCHKSTAISDSAWQPFCVLRDCHHAFVGWRMLDRGRCLHVHKKGKWCKKTVMHILLFTHIHTHTHTYTHIHTHTHTSRIKSQLFPPLFPRQINLLLFTAVSIVFPSSRDSCDRRPKSRSTWPHREPMWPRTGTGDRWWA